MKYAPDDIKGPKGLQVARDALKRKVEPDTAMALAQQLFAAADDVKAQDGAFLIADELAKKGNAQALLMLGDFYSPKQPQRGTIQKDTDMANDCYKKALAARSRRSPAAAGCVEVERILGRGRKPFLKKVFPSPPQTLPALRQPPPLQRRFSTGTGDHVSAAAFTLAAVFRRRLLSFNARRLLLQKVFSLAGASCLSLRTHYPDRRIP